MADGYSQVYNHRSCVDIHLRGCAGKWIIYLGGSLAIVITLLAGLWLVNDKRKDDKMGALIMFGLVSVIAIVGVIYFNHKDKKIYEKAHKILSNV